MKPKAPPSEILHCLEQDRKSLVQAFGFSIVAGSLVLAPTFYMFAVYDQVLNSASLTTLLWVTVLVAGALAVMESLEWVRAEVMRGIAFRMDQQVQPRVLQALFELNRVKGRSVGLQPVNDLKVVREFIYSNPVLSLFEAPASLIFLVVVWFISPLLGWVALGAGLLQVFLGVLNDQRTQPPLLQGNKASVEAQRYADNSLRNAEAIQGMGMLSAIHGRWFSKQREFLRHQAIASDRGGVFQALTKSLQLTVSSGMLGLGCWLMLNNELNGGPGMMIVAGTLGGRILTPLVQVVSQWRMVVNARESYERLNTLLAAVPAPKETMPLPAPQGQLTVEALSAGAPGSNALILKGLNFAVPAGTVLAVVGPSASGKSSLARLLVGLWPAGNGKVRLDGADVFAWNKAELGPHLGYLPQDVELFEGTLAENIARFGPADPELLARAAAEAGLSELVQSLPQGFETAIGRDGETLSGGQRQRVGLARAIYGNPRLLVLDEPNSNLDEAGDAALAQMVQIKKSQGVTVVIITHRMGILQVVDQMLVLRDGTLALFGPRDEVLAALKPKPPAPPSSPPAPTAIGAPA